ncbi:MAG: DUF4097 family beta strand repeat-containing protein [Clostridium sp.]
MKKRIIPRGMKIFMAILLTIGIASYIGAGSVLYNSGYKLSNYYDEIEDIIYWDGFKYNYSNMVTTKLIEVLPENKTINISTNNSNIEVVGYEGTELKVELYGNFKSQDLMEEYINLSTNNNIINVGINKEEFSREAIIKVYIPNNYKNDITMYSNNGLISVSNIEANNFTARTEQREIELRNIKSNNAVIETKYANINSDGVNFINSKVTSTSGNIDIDGMLGEGVVATRSGEIDLDLISVGKLLEIKSDSGNVNLDMSLGLSYIVNYSTNSGNMMCYDWDFSNNENGVRTFTQGNGENKILVNTQSGSLNIN